VAPGAEQDGEGDGGDSKGASVGLNALSHGDNASPHLLRQDRRRRGTPLFDDGSPSPPLHLAPACQDRGRSDLVALRPVRSPTQQQGSKIGWGWAGQISDRIAIVVVCGYCCCYCYLSDENWSMMMMVIVIVLLG
jgi:hypothetical protein